MQKSINLLITLVFSLTLGGISAPAASLFPGSMVGPDCCDGSEYLPENTSARRQVLSAPAKNLCPDLTRCDSVALLALQCIQSTPPPQDVKSLSQSRPAQVLSSEFEEKEVCFHSVKKLSTPTLTSRDILHTHSILII